MSKDSKHTVLITGAAGQLGGHLASVLRADYRLRLMVQSEAQATEALRTCGEVIACDLADLPGLKRSCAGVDTVVHLAAAASPTSTWAQLLPANIVGVYHLYVAAIAAKCRRVVYASSIHAVSGYPSDHQVREPDPVNPGTLYGVSKCFGEALARYAVAQEGLASSIVVRLGACCDLERKLPASLATQLDLVLSYTDLAQFVRRCIDVEDVPFAILHALSDQPFKRLDIAAARALVGYQPADDFSGLFPALRGIGRDNQADALSVVPGKLRSGMRDDLRD